MHSSWSLVAFTLFVQSAAGTVWCMQVVQLSQPELFSAACLRYLVFGALAAAVAGLAAAFGHLGNPMASFNAIRNLKRSWLSRELATVSAFTAVLIVTATSAMSGPDSMVANLFPFPLVPLASLAAAAALYAMIHVYRLRTVPSWNHAGTPLNYLGATLLLGGMVFLSASYFWLWAGWMGFEASVNMFRHIGLTVILIGCLLKVAASMATSPITSDMPKMGRLVMEIARGVGVVALLTLWGLSKAGTAVQLGLLLSAVAGLVVGEIMQRIRFYQGYKRVGL